MYVFTPLQTATGGSPVVVALTLIALFATAALSLVVAYLLIQGYRENRNRARLYLAVGLILLTTGPIVLQFVLTNFTDASAGIRSAAANMSKLVGLAAMVYAVYGVTHSNQQPHPEQESDLKPDPDRSEEGDS